MATRALLGLLDEPDIENPPLPVRVYMVNPLTETVKGETREREGNSTFSTSPGEMDSSVWAEKLAKDSRRISVILNSALRARIQEWTNGEEKQCAECAEAIRRRDGDKVARFVNGLDTDRLMNLLGVVLGQKLAEPTSSFFKAIVMATAKKGRYPKLTDNVRSLEPRDSCTEEDNELITFLIKHEENIPWVLAAANVLANDSPSSIAYKAIRGALGEKPFAGITRESVVCARKFFKKETGLDPLQVRLSRGRRGSPAQTDLTNASLPQLHGERREHFRRREELTMKLVGELLGLYEKRKADSGNELASASKSNKATETRIRRLEKEILSSIDDIVQGAVRSFMRSNGLSQQLYEDLYRIGQGAVFANLSQSKAGNPTLVHCTIKIGTLARVIGKAIEESLRRVDLASYGESPSGDPRSRPRALMQETYHHLYYFEASAL